jgi:hypothetical protein
VGYGVGPNHEHEALLWHGTAASAVNLNPAGFVYTIASGSNGTEQVGEGYGPATDGQEHALLWSGDAKSYIDLSASLPAGYTKSFAFSINAAGEVFGYAEDTAGSIAPIEWEAPAWADENGSISGGFRSSAICCALKKRPKNRPFANGATELDERTRAIFISPAPAIGSGTPEPGGPAMLAFICATLTLHRKPRPARV